jgi:hypothetical protein
MDIVTLLIQLVSGAAGGTVAGGMFKSLSLGGFGNTLAGVVGGGLGSQIVNSMLGASAAAIGANTEPDIGAIITQIAGGGVGGSILVMLVGILKQAFQPR